MTDSSQEKGRSPTPAKHEERAEGDTGPSGRARGRGKKPEREPEIGGPKGPEPTRYGDWERKGIAHDF